MLRMSGVTDTHQMSYIFGTTSSSLNDDGNFKNSGNVRNVLRNVEHFSNVRTDIKCNTFSEPQTGTKLNDDSYFRNGGNVRNVGNFRNVENFRNLDNLRNVDNFRNVGNFRNVDNFLKYQDRLKCNTISEP